MVFRVANERMLQGLAKAENLVFSRVVNEKMMQKHMNGHNLVFSRVAKGEESGQPAAADMRELVWDDELEAIAQR